MLQVLELTKENVIATKVSGKLTKKDIEKIHPLIHTILDRKLKIRWYCEIDGLTEWDIPTLWEYLNKDTAHTKDYEKIAMVGNEKWKDRISQFLKPFGNAEIVYFDNNQKKEAKSWIKYAME